WFLLPGSWFLVPGFSVPNRSDRALGTGAPTGHVTNRKPGTGNVRVVESQRPRYLHHLVHLQLIALVDVVEVLDRQAALEACLHFANVVLEALERIELAIVDHDVVAQHAD